MLTVTPNLSDILTLWITSSKIVHVLNRFGATNLGILLIIMQIDSFKNHIYGIIWYSHIKVFDVNKNSSCEASLLVSVLCNILEHDNILYYAKILEHDNILESSVSASKEMSLVTDTIYLQTFKTWSDISLWHKGYTSYPNIHYVNPCLLIQGQLRAVAGDTWKPCRMRCEFIWCLVKPPTGQARLSTRYGQPDLSAVCHQCLIYLHRHTHAHTTFFHVLLCFQWKLLLSLYFKWDSHPALLKKVKE